MKRRWKWWDTTWRDPDAYIAVSHVVPNALGNYETSRNMAVFGSTNTVSGTVINADAIQKTDGTARMFACTATKIYEVTGSAATDRSSGGGSYTSGTHWSCAEYGDVTVYTNRAANVQASSSGAFADLAGSPPKARYVCAQSLAVVLAAYNDGVNTYEDGLWFSDIGDHTTWTPSSSNEAANLRLLQTPGPITAIAAFKGDVLAWKANSFYRVSYVGLPVIWAPVLVSDNIGAAGPGAVCVCGDVVLFQGESGWFVYDGTGSPRKIAPAKIHASRSFGGPIDHASGASHFETSTGLAHFAVSGSGVTRCTAVQMTPGDGFGMFGVYGAVTSGSASATIRALVRGTAPAIYAAGIGTAASQSSAAFFLASGSDSLPYTTVNWWGSQNESQTAAVVTSNFGAVSVKTLFGRVTPLLGYWAGETFAGSCTGTFGERSDGADTATTQAGALSPAASNPRFDFSRSSRFARYEIGVTSEPMEIEDILVDMKPAGTE